MLGFADDTVLTFGVTSQDTYSCESGQIYYTDYTGLFCPYCIEQTRYNEEDERAIVNGAHTNAILQQLVHKYVELFVLCPNCRLPESSEFINSALYFVCSLPIFMIFRRSCRLSEYVCANVVDGLTHSPTYLVPPGSLPYLKGQPSKCYPPSLLLV